MSHSTVNLQTATGHQVLAAAGKTILRPGGRSATEQLFNWADFKPGDTVLELASSFGDSAISLAQRFGVRVVGVEKNPDSVARAKANIKAAGLEGQVEIIEGDIFRLDAISEEFDWVFAEAILSMQSIPGKNKILQGVQKRLKPGGKFLAHELIAQKHESEIHEDLAPIIRSNTTPLSEQHWIDIFAGAGLQVKQHKVGPFKLLDLRQIIEEEGLFSTIKILWNLFTRPVIRERVLSMRRVFEKYQEDLGYIVLVASKES